MTAQRAAKEHGLTKKGNKVIMKNSGGTIVKVDKNAKVYHRGNNKFAQYSSARDRARQSKGVNQIAARKQNFKVGEGPYRHTHDGKKGFQNRKRRK